MISIISKNDDNSNLSLLSDVIFSNKEINTAKAIIKQFSSIDNSAITSNLNHKFNDTESHFYVVSNLTFLVNTFKYNECASIMDNSIIKKLVDLIVLIEKNFKIDFSLLVSNCYFSLQENQRVVFFNDLIDTKLELSRFLIEKPIVWNQILNSSLNQFNSHSKESCDFILNANLKHNIFFNNIDLINTKSNGTQSLVVAFIFKNYSQSNYKEINLSELFEKTKSLGLTEYLKIVDLVEKKDLKSLIDLKSNFSYTVMYELLRKSPNTVSFEEFEKLTKVIFLVR